MGHHGLAPWSPVGALSVPHTRLICRVNHEAPSEAVRHRDHGFCPFAGLTRSLGEPLEPSAKPFNVHASAGEELAAEAHVETGPADDVGHKGVAGDKAAAGQSDRERTNVEAVARAAPSRGEVAFEDRLEAQLAVALDCATLVEAAREFAQQREQWKVRACGRLEPMRLRLRDGDCSAGDGGPEGWLELTEGDLPLHDSAQVILIEVEELQRAPASWVVSGAGSLRRLRHRLGRADGPVITRVGLPAWAYPRRYAPSASAALS
jgi:hypothetical protein